MIWLTWRQFRAQAAAVYVAVAAFAVVLAITGPRLLRLSRAYPDSVFDQLTRTDQHFYNAGLVALALAPAIVGAFWGAPMVARELESGTHRLVWNQTVTRTRWLATKLGVTVLAAVACARNWRQVSQIIEGPPVRAGGRSRRLPAGSCTPGRGPRG